jgi:hypothetical protein
MERVHQDNDVRPGRISEKFLARRRNELGSDRRRERLDIFGDGLVDRNIRRIPEALCRAKPYEEPAEARAVIDKNGISSP